MSVLLLVSSMAALDTKIVRKLAASLERAIGVALEPLAIFSRSVSAIGTHALIRTSLSLVLMSCMSTLSAELLG